MQGIQIPNSKKKNICKSFVMIPGFLDFVPNSTMIKQNKQNKILLCFIEKKNQI